MLVVFDENELKNKKLWQLSQQKNLCLFVCPAVKNICCSFLQLNLFVIKLHISSKKKANFSFVLPYETIQKNLSFSMQLLSSEKINFFLQKEWCPSGKRNWIIMEKISIFFFLKISIHSHRMHLMILLCVFFLKIDSKEHSLLPTY